MAERGTAGPGGNDHWMAGRREAKGLHLATISVEFVVVVIFFPSLHFFCNGTISCHVPLISDTAAANVTFLRGDSDRGKGGAGPTGPGRGKNKREKSEPSVKLGGEPPAPAAGRRPGRGA